MKLKEKEQEKMNPEQERSVEISGLELIQCIRQPGNLLISKEACALRYLKAQKERPKLFGYKVDMDSSWSLEICRTCPEGERNAKEIPVQVLKQRTKTRSQGRGRRRRIQK
ncbi:MAG: hypothetical protein JRI79_11660 [Deltaproteobacteria bacterium]|nr:hypothetical protein [Deltaproteobacteria bacterium]MBW1921004.1 hypothetical protein [Deltaproteobacteria bacterium]MBW1935453.1 hypothetical protein [Deltaproteobacteria bacterium]MBW1978605.1 hypothetical protein [Deltaproteobacteria bacterium]MBW2046160.1 hypothetical protein [Deltaproteobacteria bacterium]